MADRTPIGDPTLKTRDGNVPFPSLIGDNEGNTDTEAVRGGSRGSNAVRRIVATEPQRSGTLRYCAVR